MSCFKFLARAAGATALASVIATPATASFIALDPTRLSGNQNWTGAVGMDFDVTSSILITQLGAFDSGRDGFVGTPLVGIFDRTTGLLVGTFGSLTTANTTPGGTNSRFLDVADFMLSAGSYSIVAQGFGDFDLNGNVANGGAGPTIDTGGGLISFVGTSRYTDTTSLVFPTTIDSGPSNRYDAGTFQFTAVPAFIALDSTRLSGNQNWTGAVGMDFDVTSPIRVTQLGAFDSGRDGFVGTPLVGIFDRTTGLLVGTPGSLTTGNTTPGGTNNRFLDIADFVLGAGSYSIVAQGFGDFDLNGNVGIGGAGPTIDTGGGLISFVGTSRYTDTTSLVFPTTIDSGPSNRYDAGTFQFTAVAVPEPQPLALVGIALLALGAVRRRN